jgi:2-polyprenyl-3-methyl-5-hydroxy-6-metoxy-1,4-benzoquinol methylase
MSHFNQVANEWDNEGKVAMMQVLAKNVMEKLPLERNLKIMDFGCGTGLFGLEFSEHAKELVGIDTSSGMLEVFNKKTEGDDRFRSHNINLEEKELNEKFDLIISSMAFHHLNDPKAVLTKLKKNLNPDGKIIIVDLDEEDGSFHPDNEGMGVKHFGFSKNTLINWAKEADLKFEHYIINSIDKNEKKYQQFCAVFQ